jgi:hypothetical protein
VVGIEQFSFFFLVIHFNNTDCGYYWWYYTGCTCSVALFFIRSSCKCVYLWSFLLLLLLLLLLLTLPVRLIDWDQPHTCTCTGHPLLLTTCLPNVSQCLLAASNVPGRLVVARAAGSVKPVRAEISVRAALLPLYGSGVMVTACRHPQTNRRTAARCKGSSGVSSLYSRKWVQGCRCVQFLRAE